MVGGSVAVTIGATVTVGGAVAVGQTVTFSVGGGCTPAVETERTDGAGTAIAGFFCPVSTQAVTVTASSDETEASSEFVAD